MLLDFQQKTQPLREVSTQNSGPNRTWNIISVLISANGFARSWTLLLCVTSTVISSPCGSSWTALAFASTGTGWVGSEELSRRETAFMSGLRHSTWHRTLTGLWFWPSGSYHLSARLLQVDTVSVYKALWSRTGLPERGKIALYTNVCILV